MTDDAPANGTPEPPTTAIVNDPADEPDAPSSAATMTMTAPDGGDAPPPPPPLVGADSIEPEFPTTVNRAGTTGAVVALGSGLLGGAVAIAASRSRSGEKGDLDWSLYGVALGATAILLAIAVLGALAARRAGGRAREEVVTWPGVVGTLATGLLIGIGVDKHDDWVAYLIGGVLVALSVLGYLAARRAAFVVVAILGLALIYGVAFDNVISDSIGKGHPEVVGAVLTTIFVVVVTLVGWALPSRAVSGVVVGSFGLVGIVGVLVSFIVTRYLFSMLGDMMGMFGGSSRAPVFGWVAVSSFPASDVWWVVALAAGLTVLWVLAAAISNHSGFTILAIAMPTLVVPLAAAALAAEHPTWWAAVPAAGGGVLLVGGVLLARLRGRRTASAVASTNP